MAKCMEPNGHELNTLKLRAKRHLSESSVKFPVTVTERHLPTYMTVPRRRDWPGACTSQRLPTEMVLAWAFSSLRRWAASASRCARSSSLYGPTLLRFMKDRTVSVGRVGTGMEDRVKPDLQSMFLPQRADISCRNSILSV